MSSLFYSEKGELNKMFPLPSTIHSTAGTQQGVIIRFKTFYLKIYEAINHIDGYHVQGFRYYEENPVFDKEIPWRTFREFAKQFNREDYLTEFRG